MIERIKRRLQEAADLYRQMAEQLAKPTAQAAEVLIAALREGHTIYVCGDGGSAAQAQHVAGELVGRFMADRPALPCVALTTDTSVLTAVANDYSFEQVFERQVEALVREGDVLLLLSTSGSSANVLKAATRARKKGAKTIGLVGQSGGRLKELCDLSLSVPAETGPLIQEGHLVLLHILCGLIEQALFTRDGAESKE
ncbi:MAG TPA: SIS domain-containing protein [Phycisphaerae bacterium]|nr:SIS domain-containing protein [Phycisphaerae bacterium]